MNKFDIEDVKDFIYDYHVPIIVGAVIIFFVWLIPFLAIPIKGQTIVERQQWEWSIQLYEYRVEEKTAWGNTKSKYLGGLDSSDQWAVIPSDAYDIVARYEYYDDKKVVDETIIDNEGNEIEIYHYESIYKWRYYYKVNRWRESTVLVSSGTGKDCYEPECKYDVNVPNPKIGNIKRQSGHSETYKIISTIKEKKVIYEVSKSDYEKISKGALISYRKYRFGKKLFDIEILEKGEIDHGNTYR